ncbi:MAG TPA: threonine/serine dehydratase [Gemmatimonadales bacterium]|jgi:threonine dehydratase|nr:threonine/serine dehydratase [Gemmatimonadales bacterium]
MIELARAVDFAEARIRPWILETPLEPSPLGPFLKLENLQHTGSFKARGAFSKLLTLSPETCSRGVIAASTGNHGAAVAYAAGKLGLQARIVVAEGTDPGKLARIRALGGEVEVHGSDSALAESYARRLAEREAMVYVSPYNDLEVIAGQGTTGVELGRQLARADVVFIALGGGGLLAGVAAWLKQRWPGLTVVGCSPENSAVMIHSIRAGRILELASRPTLSDGTAGGIEAGAITFELCRDLADEYLTLSEAEIRGAMQRVLETSGYRVEGAAGVAVAGYLRQAERWRGRTAVAILCGGNVAPSVFETMDR